MFLGLVTSTRPNNPRRIVMSRTLIALIAFVTLLGGCAVTTFDGPNGKGTQVRILDPVYVAPSYRYGYDHYRGYGYGAGSTYQPVHRPLVRFDRMIRPNIRLVWVDGEARECDVRPQTTGSCLGVPSDWGSAMMNR